MPLFTTAEARAFNGGQLQDPVSFPTADITTAEARIQAEFTRLCGVAFVATSTTEALDGVYSDTIRVNLHNPLREMPQRAISVTAAAIDGVALTATELADLACYPSGKVIRKTLGYWYGASPNRRNVSITYSHGYATVPPDITRAALIVACAQLVPTDISARATSYSDGMMTYQLTYAGSWPHPFGIPEVDAILERFRENAGGVV